jgi:hypothetical protein
MWTPPAVDRPLESAEWFNMLAQRIFLEYISASPIVERYHKRINAKFANKSRPDYLVR